MRIWSLAAVIVVALGGCSLNPTRSCSSNSDCSSGSYCDGTTKTCVVSGCYPACKSGTRCDTATKTCVKGCVPGCAAGTNCDEASNTCVAGCVPGCDAGTNCEVATNTCVAGCVPACPGGLNCDVASDTCVADCVPSCGPNTYCDSSDWTCRSSVCTPECGAGEYCDKAVCYPAHTSIAVLAPAPGTSTKSPFIVRAELIPDSGEPHTDVDYLSVFNATTNTAELQLDHEDAGDGFYSANWNPPTDGTYTFYVALPDGGMPSTPVSVTVDNTGPDLTLSWTNPTWTNSATTTYDDPGKPGAFKRNQTVQVTVSSSASDVDPNSVRVWLVDTDGGIWDVGVPTQQSGSPFLATVTVDLSKPVMNAFRYTFPIKAQASDVLGNIGAIWDGGIDVTRWNWSYALAASSTGLSPAVGHDGRVYVGTNSGMIAINPDGIFAWQNDGGAVVATPSVGALDGGVAFVYAMLSDGAAGVIPAALLADDGGVVRTCPGYTNTSATASWSVATLHDTGKYMETAVVGLNSTSGSGELLALRPLGTNAGQWCYPSTGVESFYQGTMPASITGNDAGVYYYGDDLGQIQSYSLTGGGFGQEAGWPSAPNLFVQSVALDGVDIVGGGGGGPGKGGIIALHPDGGVFWSLDAGSTSWNVTVASGDQVQVGSQSKELLVATIGADAGVALQTPSGIPEGGPLIGADKSLYAILSDGQLEVFDSTLEPLWSVSGMGSTLGSLNIDCARDMNGSVVTGPGVLYAQDTSGALYSIIVDSHGVDTSAPWPKYQHDPRNSGSTATLMSEFQCP